MRTECVRPQWGDLVLKRKVGWALAATTLGALAPLLVSGASAAAAHAAAGPSARAIVTVRPGTAMPLAVPHGRVLDSFAAVRAELVSAPRSALDSSPQ